MKLLSLFKTHTKITFSNLRVKSDFFCSLSEHKFRKNKKTNHKGWFSIVIKSKQTKQREKNYKHPYNVVYEKALDAALEASPIFI